MVSIGRPGRPARAGGHSGPGLPMCHREIVWNLFGNCVELCGKANHWPGRGHKTRSLFFHTIPHKKLVWNCLEKQIIGRDAAKKPAAFFPHNSTQKTFALVRIYS
jgi:hypothetical protein